MKIINKTQDVETLFVDGVSSAYFLNGVVRMTVGSLQTDDQLLLTEKTDMQVQDQEPAFKHELKMIMSLQGFFAAFNAMQELYNELNSKGMIPKIDMNEQHISNEKPETNLKF